MTSYDARIAAAAEARMTAYRGLGAVSTDVLAPLVGPALTGGPEWPTRPAYRIIDRPSGTRLVLSDALSDPFEELDRPQHGYALELFVETHDPSVVDVAFHEIPSTWAFGVLADVCTTVAGHGGVRALLEELGRISVETEDSRAPSALCDEAGRVGLLLNVPAPDVPHSIPTPGGEVWLVPITVLTPLELAYVRREQDAGRAELSARLAAAGVHHLSDPHRASLVAPSSAGFPTKRSGWS